MHSYTDKRGLKSWFNPWCDCEHCTYLRKLTRANRRFSMPVPPEMVPHDELMKHRAEMNTAESREAHRPTPILKYFEYAHLPPHLQVISAGLCELAHVMDRSLPAGAEKSAGLRKLLEAKDCFVRARLEAPV